MRVLVGGVGYRFQRDLSLGLVLVDRLKGAAWPAGVQVEVEDWGYGPIGILHALGERPAYDRIVLVSGVDRERRPGGIYQYAWSTTLPSDEEVQERVTEAASGVIHVDNLLVIGTYFKRFPADVDVIEVEPVESSWGEPLSEAVEALVPDLIARLRRLVGQGEA